MVHVNLVDIYMSSYDVRISVVCCLYDTTTTVVLVGTTIILYCCLYDMTRVDSTNRIKYLKICQKMLSYRDRQSITEIGCNLKRYSCA